MVVSNADLYYIMVWMCNLKFFRFQLEMAGVFCLRQFVGDVSHARRMCQGVFITNPLEHSNVSVTLVLNTK